MVLIKGQHDYITALQACATTFVRDRDKYAACRCPVPEAVVVAVVQTIDEYPDEMWGISRSPDEFDAIRSMSTDSTMKNRSASCSKQIAVFSCSRSR
jgi:hypothetical protein